MFHPDQSVFSNTNPCNLHLTCLSNQATALIIACYLNGKQFPHTLSFYLYIPSSLLDHCIIQ